MGASIFIDGNPGDVAKTVLLPGDPRRAKYIADKFFEDAVCVNQIRNNLGYTGNYRGHRVSVMGTGMGMPSIAMYAHDLIIEYGCRNLIRVGTAGSYQPDIGLRDLVMAVAASTDSNFQHNFNLPGQFSPSGDFNLMLAAHRAAEDNGIKLNAGNVVSSDIFFDDDPDTWKKWAKMGVLAVEMETAALYMCAARYGARALSILTVTDDFAKGSKLTAEERELCFKNMSVVALNIMDYL